MDFSTTSDSGSKSSFGLQRQMTCSARDTQPADISEVCLDIEVILREALEYIALHVPIPYSPTEDLEDTLPEATFYNNLTELMNQKNAAKPEGRVLAADDCAQCVQSFRHAPIHFLRSVLSATYRTEKFRTKEEYLKWAFIELIHKNSSVDQAAILVCLLRVSEFLELQVAPGKFWIPNFDGEVCLEYHCQIILYQTVFSLLDVPLDERVLPKMRVGANGTLNDNLTSMLEHGMYQFKKTRLKKLMCLL